jgi:hypothetical protein
MSIIRSDEDGHEMFETEIRRGTRSNIMTSMIGKVVTIAATILSLMAGTAAAGVEVAFRKGDTNSYVANYQDMKDNFVAVSHDNIPPGGGISTYNYGGFGVLYVGARAPGSKHARERILMRWNLSCLNGAYALGVRSASLSFKIAAANTVTTNAYGWIHLFALKPGNADWVAGTRTTSGAQSGYSCWAYRKYTSSSWVSGVTDPEGSPADQWTTAGYAAGGFWPSGPLLKSYATDTNGVKVYQNDSYYNTPIGSFFWNGGAGQAAGDTISIKLEGVAGVGDGSLTALIDQWASTNQNQNAGVIMIGQQELKTSTAYNYGPDLYSSEAAALANRPLLRLTIVTGTIILIR